MRSIPPREFDDSSRSETKTADAGGQLLIRRFDLKKIDPAYSSRSTQAKNSTAA
jgi:hypothetical protein